MSAKAASTVLDHPDLAEYIEQDPHKPGRHNARFIEYGHHVWAIIAYLRGGNWDVVQTAKAWNMTEETVQAAIQYYERHRELYDAYFLLEEEEYNAGD
jgi:uncharacterized protein (DUF433 family)